MSRSDQSRRSTSKKVAKGGRNHVDKFAGKASGKARAFVQPPAATPKPVVVPIGPQSPSPDQVRVLVYEKTLDRSLNFAKSRGWNEEMCSAIEVYVGFLVYGTSSPDEAVGHILDADQQRNVILTADRRFATTCWYKRHDIKDLKLPGMTRPGYERNLKSAEDYAASFKPRKPS